MLKIAVWTAVAIFWSALAYAAFTSKTLSLQVTVGQTIASITPSSCSFVPGTQNGAVCNLSVTMNPATPVSTAALSLTGVNTGNFHLLGLGCSNVSNLSSSTSPSGPSLTTADGTWAWGSAAAGRPGEYNINLNGVLTGIGTLMQVTSGKLYVNTASLGWFAWNGASFGASSAPGAPDSCLIQESGSLSGTPAGTYTDVSVVAVQAGIPSRTQALTLTGSAGGGTPAPAVAAGFTTAAVNVDFSQVASNWVSANIDSCGGPTNGLRWTWRALGNNSLQAPCSRLNLETDSSVSKQVLHIQTTPADTAVGALGLSWPGVPFGGDTSTMLPVQGYTEITFRTTASSLNQTITGYSIIGIYLPNGPNRNPNWFEADGLEALPQSNDGTGWIYGDGGLEWDGASNSIITALCCSTPDYTKLRADLATYHTIGWLFTSDGTQIWKCYYLDGNPLLNPCASNTGLSNPSWELGEHDLIWSMGIADGGGGTTNNVDVYVQSIRIFECPTWLSGSSSCFGTTITH